MEENKIVLKIAAADRDEMTIRVKKDQNFDKTIRQVCEKLLQVRPESVVFTFDGVRIEGTATPNTLMMEDEDQIDVI